MTEPRRPTHTVYVPDLLTAADVCADLLKAGCTFTAEPSPDVPGVWHIGVFKDGVTVIERAFATRGR